MECTTYALRSLGSGIQGKHLPRVRWNRRSSLCSEEKIPTGGGHLSYRSSSQEVFRERNKRTGGGTRTMTEKVLFLILSVIGIDPGWERLPDGGWRYYIQLDEENLKALRNGEPLESDVPPQLEKIRTYRIVFAGPPVPRDPLPTSSPQRWATPSDGPNAPSESNSKPFFRGPLPQGGSAEQKRPADKASGEKSGFPSKTASSASGQGFPTQTLPATAVEGATPSGPSSGSAKPWWPLSMAIAVACACFGGMVYTSWLAWDYRRKYHQLWDQMAEAGLSPDP